jgi:hypothetical protein
MAVGQVGAFATGDLRTGIVATAGAAIGPTTVGVSADVAGAGGGGVTGGVTAWPPTTGRTLPSGPID